MTTQPTPATPPTAIEKLLAAQCTQLARIADALEALARASAPTAPNYKRPLAAFRAFEWESINAQVVAHDQDGVSAVSWNGQTFTRRSGGGKFGNAVWFSRANGKDAEGNNLYARLITFKDESEAEPVVPAAAKAASQTLPAAPAPSRAAAPAKAPATAAPSQSSTAAPAPYRPAVSSRVAPSQTLPAQAPKAPAPSAPKPAPQATTSRAPSAPPARGQKVSDADALWGG